MPTYTRHDIDAMGFKAVEDFNRGVSLHDSLVKLSVDNRMNPEQIKRLVESANTSTFLDQFKTKQGNQRMVEFDVADPSRVIDAALGGEQPHTATSEKTPGVSITITVDSKPSLYDSVADENGKVASFDTTSDLPMSKFASFLHNEPEEPTIRDLNSLQVSRVRDSLLTKIADCNYRASEIADTVAHGYKSIYTQEKYAGLETDALSRYGNSAIPALQLLRSRLGMTKISRELTPSEEYILADRHLVEESTELTKVASIIELVDTLKVLRTSLDFVDGGRNK